MYNKLIIDKLVPGDLENNKDNINAIKQAELQEDSSSGLCWPKKIPYMRIFFANFTNT